ncbi:MAG TPA: PVC-type heme-binding CxxCH protein [Urbifossiella sp.]
MVRITFAALLAILIHQSLAAMRSPRSGALSAGENDPAAARSPQNERTTFKLAKGFDIQLVASDPDVVDPVAMCFDDKGRLFVCEMRGYPNGGIGTGQESRGKIKCLTDADGDGRFETSHVFAEGLRFPMGITPYKNGLLVAVAPDILYLEDTDGDGKSDKTTVLYTGFNLANIQQMVNGLQWGLDNWIYGCAGNDGGIVSSGQRPEANTVSLRNRGLRFQPWRPASLEPISSGGQYGFTSDDYEHWFTATNSEHLKQIVLPDHYLRRNPYLPVPTVTINIPEHGAAAKVFRISPFEAWRVERTTRRAGSPDAKRFPPTELVPGGFITSACSPLIYTADLFPEAYRGNNFVCDPANNLIHREVLVGKGAVFSAKRVDPDSEFLASTDNWFRPVQLAIGPDGAMYVLDFYREVIETPLSLPEDIKKKLNLESRGRGRIWRIAPDGFKPAKLPDRSRYTAAQLADELLSANSTRRITAQRLLVERQPKDAAGAIRERLPKSAGRPGRANLLWTLHGLGQLQAADVLPIYDDPVSGIREQALRLSEEFFARSQELRSRAAKLIDDPEPRVRFQLAFSAGELPAAEAGKLLAAILEKDAGDPWIQTAALSSASQCSSALIEALLTKKGNAPVLAKLAAMTGAKGNEAEIVRLLNLIAEGQGGAASDAALLEGLGQGTRNGKKPLSTWWAKPPAGAEAAMAKLRGRFERAAAAVKDESLDAAQRTAAAGLLALGPFDIAGSALAEALGPNSPGDLQLAAVRGLAAHSEPKVGDILLAKWSGFGPALRREVLDALLARPDRIVKLLDAIEKKQVAPSELDPARVMLLKMHPTETIRTRAAAILKSSVNADRSKIVAEYAGTLELKGDAEKGRGVFKMNCSACHKLDGVGHDVGANLLAALPNKSGEDLLVSLFDPNREVDPRYVNYQAVTADGRILLGIVATETPTSITMRRADGVEDTILRKDLETLRSTKLSLMPEEMEKKLTKQDVADLFAYLKIAGK